MKIRIIKEIYIKRDCTKKTTKEKGDCAVLDPQTKKQTACYDNCDTARAAKHATNEEQLDEMSGMAGGGVAIAPGPIIDDDENKSLEEMFSTSTQTGSFRIKIISGDKEHLAHVEKAKYQGVKNVLNDDNHE